jgi:hypothetical protein
MPYPRPPLGLLDGDGREEWTMTLSAFSKGLEGLLETLCARPRRWILIVERGDRPHLFWQALAFEDGSLVTETVSNHYLPDEHHGRAPKRNGFSRLGGRGM